MSLPGDAALWAWQLNLLSLIITSRSLAPIQVWFEVGSVHQVSFIYIYIGSFNTTNYGSISYPPSRDGRAVSWPNWYKCNLNAIYANAKMLHKTSYCDAMGCDVTWCDLMWCGVVLCCVMLQVSRQEQANQLFVIDIICWHRMLLIHARLHALEPDRRRRASRNPSSTDRHRWSTTFLGNSISSRKRCNLILLIFLHTQTQTQERDGCIHRRKLAVNLTVSEADLSWPLWARRNAYTTPTKWWDHFSAPQHITWE